MASPRSERGEVTSTVMVFPILLTIILAIVQTALSMSARAQMVEPVRHAIATYERTAPADPTDPTADDVCSAFRFRDWSGITHFRADDTVPCDKKNRVITLTIHPTCLIPPLCPAVTRSFYVGHQVSRSPWDRRGAGG